MRSSARGGYGTKDATSPMGQPLARSGGLELRDGGIHAWVVKSSEALSDGGEGESSVFFT